MMYREFLRKRNLDDLMKERAGCIDLLEQANVKERELLRQGKTARARHYAEIIGQYGRKVNALNDEIESRKKAM